MLTLTEIAGVGIMRGITPPSLLHPMIQSFFQTVDEHPAQIIADWMRLDDRPRTELAASLTQVAIERGFSEPRSPVKGLTLVDWIKTGKAPLWARLAAFCLALDKGWRPGTAAEWARWAFLHDRSSPRGTSLNEQLARLPEGIDNTAAAGWLVAVRENDRLHQANKQLRGL